MSGLTIFAKLWGSNVTVGIQIILCNSEVTLKVKYPRYIAQSWDELRETAKCILKSSILLSANMNLDCIWFGFEIYIILSLLLKIETANKINYNIYWVYLQNILFVQLSGSLILLYMQKNVSSYFFMYFTTVIFLRVIVSWLTSRWMCLPTFWRRFWVRTRHFFNKVCSN